MTHYDSLLNHIISHPIYFIHRYTKDAVIWEKNIFTINNRTIINSYNSFDEYTQLTELLGQEISEQIEKYSTYVNI